VGDADDERQASWRAMNAFAAELIKLHATVFTLNYDSLLMSALLEQRAMVYDGFRFGTLNVPLDREDSDRIRTLIPIESERRFRGF